MKLFLTLFLISINLVFAAGGDGNGDNAENKDGFKPRAISGTEIVNKVEVVDGVKRDVIDPLEGKTFVVERDPNKPLISLNWLGAGSGMVCDTDKIASHEAQKLAMKQAAENIEVEDSEDSKKKEELIAKINDLKCGQSVDQLNKQLEELGKKNIELVILEDEQDEEEIKILNDNKKNKPRTDVVITKDNSHDDNDNCFVRGNSIFESKCNAFNGSINAGAGFEVLSEIGSALVIAEEFTKQENFVQMRASQPEVECDKCMSKVHSLYTGKSASDPIDTHVAELKAAKEDVARDVVEKLKPKTIVKELFDLSKTMEDVTSAQAVFAKSFEIYKQGKDDAEIAKLESSMKCQNEDDLNNHIQASCAQSGFDINAAKKHIEDSFKSINISSGPFSDRLASLNSLSTTRPTNECGGDKLSIGDHQVSHYLAGLTKEKNLGEKAPTFQVYKMIDAMAQLDPAVANYCNGSSDDVKIGPLTTRQPGMYIGRTLRRLSDSTKSVDSSKEEYFKIKQFITTLDGYEAESGGAFIKTYIQEALETDPNIKMLLSDWDSLCNLKTQLANNDGQKDDGLPRSMSIMRDSLNKGDDASFHKEQVERVMNYAKARCNNAFKKIADVICYAGSNINSPLFSGYDFKKASAEVFDDINTAADNTAGNDNEFLAKKVALGALVCSDMDLEANSNLARDPLRKLDMFELSDFSRKTLKDSKLRTDQRCSADGRVCDSLFKEHGTFTALSEEGQKKLCPRSSDVALNRSLVNNKVYGEEIDEETTTNYFKTHVEEFLENDSDFAQDVADQFFPGDGAVNDAINRFNKRRQRRGNVAGGNVNSNIVNNKSGIPGFDVDALEKEAFGDMDTNFNSITPDMERTINERIQNEAEIAKKTAVENADNNVDAIAEAWKKERDALMAKHEAELKALREQLDIAGKSPDTPKTGAGSLEDLKSKIADLENRKKMLSQADEDMQEMIKEKSKIDNKVAAAAVDKKKDELVREVSKGRAPSSIAGAFSSVTGAKFNDGISQVPRSNYQPGVGGYVYVQDDNLSAIQLKDLADQFTGGDIGEADIKLDFIKVGDVPKLVKIPGFTSSYVEIDDLKKMIEADPRLSFLTKYLEAAKINTQNLPEEDGKAEVLIASLDEVMDPPARLKEMKMALDYSKFREACQENNKAGANEAILFIEYQDADLANGMSCD